MLHIRTRATDGSGRGRVTIRGELHRGQTLERLVAETGRTAAGGASRLELDLDGVTTIDAAGVGALVQVRHQLARAGVRLVLVRPTRRVREVLRVCRLGEVFEIADETRPDSSGAAAPADSVGADALAVA